MWLFRTAFGWLSVVLVARYFVHDWIGHYFIEPKFFFTYFDWWRPLPGRAMYVEFAVLGLAALGIALNRWPRACAAVFWLLFTHQHFSDKTIYLNHYYFIAQLAFLFACLPLGTERDRPIPAWALWVVRAQLALVYFYGGVGKLNPDWMLRAQPLATWLHSSGGLPLIGGLLDRPATAYLMSWAGAAFDLTIVGFLLWRRTRTAAYIAVVFFHVITGALFPIGMFPWMMMAGATLFFDPAWPRHWLRRRSQGEPQSSPRAVRWLLALHLVVQALLPLRSWFYPGDVNWTEQGFRFSWKVMLIDKSGVADFRVVSRSGRRFEVNPRTLLTPLQYRMMATQPDMIEQLAQHIACRWATLAGEPVSVYGDVFVAYNGRPPERLVPGDRVLATCAP